MPNRTILLIDFDPTSIDRATSSLLNAGYRVEVARDGVEGVEAFQRVKPDLVLIEAMVPKKHGFEVCQEIKKAEGGHCTPVLITTAESRGSRFVNDAIKIYGCDDFFEKPIEEEELLSACRRFLSDDDTVQESAGLESLSEEEIIERLDALLDESREASSDPVEGASPGEEQDEPPVPRKIEDEDLLSFCDRVFTVQGGRREQQPEPLSADSTPAPTTEDDTPRAASGAPPPDLSPVDEIKVELEALFDDAPIQPDPQTVTSLGAVPTSPEVVDDEAHDPPIDETSTSPDPETDSDFSAAETKDDAKAEEVPVVMTAPTSLGAATVVSDIEEPGEPAEVELASEARAKEEPEQPTEGLQLDEPDAGAVEAVPAVAASAASTGARPVLSAEIELPSTSDTAVESSRPDGERRSSKLPWILGTAAALFVAGAAVTAYLTLWGSHPSNLPTAVASKATLGRLPQPVVPRSGPSFNSELVDEAGLGMDPVGASQGASLIAMDANATRDPATTPAGRGSPEPSEPKATASRSSVPIPVAKERGEGRSRDSSTRHETDVAAATVLPPIAKVDPSDGVDSRPGTSAEPEEIVSRASGSVEEVVEDPLAQSSPPPTQLSAETAMAPAQPTLHRAKIQRGSLIDINEVDSLPTPISRPDPEYPTFSQRMRHEGRVVLNLLIDENGRVIDIDVIDGVPRTRLDQAAIDAARRWIYRPALKDGVAVKVWKTAEFIFRL